jgi:hypothetical protein
MTPEFFEEQMNRLAGLKFPPSTMETHWEALRELPPHVLEAAVTLAQRTRVDFPTPVELRRDADQATATRYQAADDRSVELPVPVPLGVLPSGHALPPATRLWRYYCDVCSDTGRQSLWCGAGRRQPWLQIDECDTYKCKSIKAGHPEYGHEWVKPCPCADSNPAVLRQREQSAKYAVTATKRGAA